MQHCSYLECPLDIYVFMGSNAKKYTICGFNLSLFLSNFSFTLHVSDTHGFKRIDLRDLPQRAAIVEKYRWPFTMALQAIFTLFCLLLFVSS